MSIEMERTNEARMTWQAARAALSVVQNGICSIATVSLLALKDANIQLCLDIQ